MKRDVEFRSRGDTCRGWFDTPDRGELLVHRITVGKGGMRLLHIDVRLPDV